MTTPKKTSESRRLTDDYLSFAEDEFKSGNLNVRVYSKVMMQISAEYLLEHYDEEASLRVLCRVDPAYIKDDLPVDMADDAGLANIMAEFAHHLERRGITWEGTVSVTQSEATA